MIVPKVTSCGRYVLLIVGESTYGTQIYYADLHDLGADRISTKLAFKNLINNFDSEYTYITNEGTVFTFLTDHRAPNNKLISIDIADPTLEQKDLVPESSTDILRGVACVANDKLLLTYVQDVKTALYIHDIKTGSRLRQYPVTTGTINAISGDRKYNEFFLQVTSFFIPTIIYRVQVHADYETTEVFYQSTVKNFDASQFETKQVFYRSKDGTRVPMFITHRKGVRLDGSSPTYLYGYGGFGHIITPHFSVFAAFFLQHFGGIYAVANIRGGGEYGETWHRDGKILNKQNTFDDFQSAAEFLIKEGYTSSSKLIVNGASNGGLTVAASCNQRPDLFQCCIPQVGVLDMLRFHKFTVGYAWMSDYGNPENKDHFENLLKFSPVHNIPDMNGTTNQYPATLVLTGDHDDRVVPLHSYKLISELQYKIGSNPSQKNPLMILITTKTGHGGGKPTAKQVEEMADIAAFIHKTVDLDWID